MVGLIIDSDIAASAITIAALSVAEKVTIGDDGARVSLPKTVAFRMALTSVALGMLTAPRVELRFQEHAIAVSKWMRRHGEGEVYRTIDRKSLTYVFLLMRGMATRTRDLITIETEERTHE